MVTEHLTDASLKAYKYRYSSDSPFPNAPEEEVGLISRAFSPWMKMKDDNSDSWTSNEIWY